MKKLLVVAVLFAAVSQQANGMLGPNGKQTLFGPGGQKISCNAGEKVYVGAQGKVSCIASGTLGSTQGNVKQPSKVGAVGRVGLIGPGGQAIKCKRGQQVYVGSNNVVRCIAKGSKGSAKKS